MRFLNRFSLLVLLLSLCTPAVFGGDNDAKPTAHIIMELDGWTVHIDQRLLEPENTSIHQRAVRMLDNSLYEIALITPAKQLAKLREVPIWLDLNNGKLQNMQYHPSAKWLKENGYDTRMEKSVHIPSAAFFTGLRHHRIQPWCVLHELAHSYHDRLLNFENPQIKSLWEKWRQKPEYQETLYVDGGKLRHYGLTNEKEFFAEMTESYFGMNDFYPFNRGELKEHEPEVFALMQEVWGQLP